MVSSGAIMPARAPPSIDMLQTVIRPAIDSARIASPRYSITEPTPPPGPSARTMPRTRSLAERSSPSLPSTVTDIAAGLTCRSVWVASTCSTSVVPIPNASAPNAPCVEVWLSPQTTVIPGWVSPSCGPMTCTMPCSMLPRPCSVMPCAAQFCRSLAICAAASGSAIGLSRPVVGTSWSIVATVRSGRRTLRPASSRPSKACGDVTSCTRCRSMYSRGGSPSGLTTRWRSQTLSNRRPRTRSL